MLAADLKILNFRNSSTKNRNLLKLSNNVIYKANSETKMVLFLCFSYRYVLFFFFFLFIVMNFLLLFADCIEQPQHSTDTNFKMNFKINIKLNTGERGTLEDKKRKGALGVLLRITCSTWEKSMTPLSPKALASSLGKEKTQNFSVGEWGKTTYVKDLQ